MIETFNKVLARQRIKDNCMRECNRISRSRLSNSRKKKGYEEQYKIRDQQLSRLDRII